MRWLNRLWFRIRALFTSGRMSRELDAEMAFHLEMETEKLVRAGLDPDDAAARARRAFGSPRRQRDRARWEWGATFLRDLVQDTRLVGRHMRRDPAFAAGAILTLALGIGANTAIFSVADQALMREPPVADADRLVSVYTTCRSGFPRCSSSWPDIVDYRDRTRTVDDLAAYSPVPLNVGAEQSARLATGMLVTGNYFDLLGVGAHAGRTIQPSDAAPYASAQVAVLGHDFWVEAFGADPDIVGDVVRLNGAPFEVVGIAPAGYHGLTLNGDSDVFLPIFAAPALGPGVGAASNPEAPDLRGNRWVGALVGRLAPGASVEQAQAEMDVLAAALGDEYPDERAAMDGPRQITVDPIDGYILPLGSEETLEGFVLLLVGVVAMTLVLATANLANLLLARGTSRGREIGIRMAVGAGRSRVIRQLLTESVILALIGGAAGLGVAAVALGALGSFELPGGVVIGDLGVGLDGSVLAFTFVLSVATAVLFGLIPALQTSRGDLIGAVRGETSTGGGQSPLRKGLVAVQVGLCLVLLVGSGLFLRTLRNSLGEDLGFEPRGAVTARFNLSLLAYGDEQAQVFGADLLAGVRALPGVEAASLATLVPFQRGGFRGTFVTVDGYEPRPDEEMRVDWVLVDTEYFEALGGRVLEGREFTATDMEGSPGIAVINRDMAERYWPGRSALGGRVHLNEQQSFEVIGVVENPTWGAVGEVSSPFIFFPQRHNPSLASSFFTLVVRTEGDAESLLPAVRDRFRSLDPGLSLTSLATFDDQVGGALMPQRMGSVLLTMLGGLALLLAAVGVYGVVSYAVRRRARDIGIRIAVGASGGRILLAVVRDMLLPIGTGLALGAVAAWLLSDTAEAFLFGVSATDPATFAGIAVLLLGVALGATLLPARAASRIDPAEVLKSE
ncbi:MAG: ABC transporter permease [Gemmatimonadota bacterium]|nr:ABC transporter permease [Gemmatimonadota bacterium]